MAKLETKTVTVSPNEEQTVIQFYEKFGWNVQSSQEIFNQDTRQEVRDDSLWDVTTTTNYVKIVFQRDKEMKNYEQIKKLQEEYEKHELILRRAPGLFPGKVLLIVIIALVGIGILQIFGGLWQGIIFILIGGGIFALRYFLKYKPKDAEAVQSYGRKLEIEKELEELI